MAEQSNKQQEQTTAAQSSVQSAAVSQQQQQQQQQQVRPCPRDCGKCTPGHQIYCTAKMTFDSFTVMNAILQRLTEMSEKIDTQSKIISELGGRIAALEISATDLASPAPVQGDLFPPNE